MVRLLLIGLLALSIACMVPLMGTGHAETGHLHHDATASCATCMGSEPSLGDLFLLTMLGFSVLMVPARPPSAPVHGLFHPPRVR